MEKNAYKTDEIKQQKDSTLELEIVTFLKEEELKKKYRSILKEKYRIDKKATSNKVQKNSVNIYPFYKWKNIAAIFFIFGATYFAMLNINDYSAKQMAVNFANDTNLLGNQNMMRKDASRNHELEMKAIHAFLEKNYSLYISMMKELEKVKPLKDIDYFYLGAAHLRIKPVDEKNSILYLSKIKDTSFKDEADWFLALALIMEGDRSKANSLLNNIVQKGSYKVDQAKKLLEKIKDEN